MERPGYVGGHTRAGIAVMCPTCGAETWGTRELCEHHLSPDTLECMGNRILCDLIHRGVEPKRLSAEDREPQAFEDVEIAPPVPVDF